MEPADKIHAVAQRALMERPRWSLVFAAFALIIAALLAYHNSFTGPFILDDDDSIKFNPTLQSLWSAWWPPTGNGITVSGRPFLNFSLALNYAVSGRQVWSYHGLNLLIHVGAGLLLFGVVRRSLRQPVLAARFGVDSTWLALAVALLWVVHPLQTESVTYIVQRAESLVGLCYLFTFWCFLRAVESGAARRWQVLAFVGCLLGMAAKEVMVTAPVLIAFYDRLLVAGGWREVWVRRGKFHLALASTWLLLAGLMISTGSRGGTAGLGTVSSVDYALTQVFAIGHYLRLTFWPSPLVFDYGTALHTDAASVLPGALLLLPLALASLWAAARGRPWGFCGMFFFGVLAPSSSFVPVVTQTMAEHRMYLPLAAVVAIVVLSLYRLLARKSGIIFGMMAIALIFTTIQRNRDYQTALSLWEDTVLKWPDNARSRSNLGAILIYDSIRRAEGMRHIARAIELSPNDPRPHNNLGLGLVYLTGREPEAIAAFEKVVSLAPDYALGHVNLGEELHKVPGRQAEALVHLNRALQLSPQFAYAHAAMGQVLLDYPERRKEAIAQLEEAVRLDPEEADAQGNLGIAIAADPGRLPEAIAHLKTALRLQNFSAKVRNNLAAILAKIPGQQEEAIQGYESAIKLQPNYWEAHYNLGMLLLDLPDRKSAAVPHLEAAGRLAPENANVRTNLGFALADLSGRLEDASREFAAAVRLQPDSADAHFNCGTALLRLTGHEAEAIAEFQAVLRINPKDADAHNNLGLLYANSPGRSTEAAEQFKIALQLNPDLADAHFNLAKLMAASPAQTSEAVSQLNAALKLAPDHQSARELLAQITRNPPGMIPPAEFDAAINPARKKLPAIPLGE